LRLDSCFESAIALQAFTSLEQRKKSGLLQKAISVRAHAFAGDDLCLFVSIHCHNATKLIQHVQSEIPSLSASMFKVKYPH